MTAPLPFDRIHLFELLKPKLGAEESKAIVDAIDSVSSAVKSEVETTLESSAKGLATKEDISRLALATREDISQVKADINKLEVKMNERFNSMLIWIISAIFAAAGLLIAVIKL